MFFVCFPVSVTEGSGGRALPTKLLSKAELHMKIEWREEKGLHWALYSQDSSNWTGEV